jgi:hypothetical protein
MFQYDPYCTPLPFNEAPFAKTAPKAKIGWFVNDGFFDACAATARAVSTAKQALEEAGYELVPFTVPDPNEYMQVYGVRF